MAYPDLGVWSEKKVKAYYEFVEKYGNEIASIHEILSVEDIEKLTFADAANKLYRLRPGRIRGEYQLQELQPEFYPDVPEEQTVEIGKEPNVAELLAQRKEQEDIPARRRRAKDETV